MPSERIPLYNATHLLADEKLGTTIPVDEHTNNVNLVLALSKINEQASPKKKYINDIRIAYYGLVR